MFKIIAPVRTVRVQDLKVESKNGTDGKPYDAKSIYLTVASDRPYKAFVTDSKGVRSKEKVRPTDFVFCRANGELAQLIADNCMHKNGDGKLISRHLLLEGHLETYKDIKKVQVERTGNYQGKQLKMKFEVDQERDNVVFVISSLEFLDPSPVKNSKPAVAPASGDMVIEAVEDGTVETVEMNMVASGEEVVGSLELPPVDQGEITLVCACGEKDLPSDTTACPKCGGTDLTPACPF